MTEEAIVLGCVGSDFGEYGECCLCGEDAEKTEGFVFFLEGTCDVVCLECAEKHAPALSNLLQAGKALEYRQLALEDAESERDDAEERVVQLDATIFEMTDEGDSDDYVLGF